MMMLEKSLQLNVVVCLHWNRPCSSSTHIHRKYPINFKCLCTLEAEKVVRSWRVHLLSHVSLPTPSTRNDSGQYFFFYYDSLNSTYFLLTTSCPLFVLWLSKWNIHRNRISHVFNLTITSEDLLLI